MTSLQTRTGDTARGRPSTSTRPGSSSGPPVREEAQRIDRLRAMKRRATGLLVVMAVAFVVITVFGDNTGWTGYVQAAVAASLVGGVADWFAVTAVFRHPLGVPIPHTAVIVERKDKFGETLGAFVQENFLSSDAMTARLREAHLSRRLGDWLADRAHAETVARHAADAAVQLSDMLRDEDVQGMLHEQVRRGLENVPLAPLAGKVLRGATEEGRHQELFDAVLRGVGRSLDEHRDWLGSLWIDAKAALRSQAADPESELRQRLADAIVAAGSRLRSDPALAAKVDDVIEWGVQYVGEHFHAEIAGLVSGTLERWDADETSRKLEILLGPDLQFIRINGTVVGGLAGLAIHFVGEVIH